MKFFLIIQLILLSFASFAQSVDLNQYLSSKWKLSKTHIKYLEKGKVIANSEVDSDSGKQTFDLKAGALHTKKCRKVLRKISRLEDYKNWIGFIKSSSYIKKSHLFTIKADHPLLPYPMIVHIIVERPTKQGKYPFTFPTGMFAGLQGYFEISEFNNRCFFYAESHWHGKETKLPNFVIEIFSETLSRIGGEVLMRKTK
jgi:hypothetical protein